MASPARTKHPDGSPFSSDASCLSSRVEATIGPRCSTVSPESPSSTTPFPPHFSHTSSSPHAGSSSATSVTSTFSSPPSPLYFQYLLPSSARLVTETQLDQHDTEEACLACYRSSFRDFFSSFPSSSLPSYSSRFSSSQLWSDDPVDVRTDGSGDEKERAEQQQSFFSKDVARLQLQRESHIAYCMRHLRRPLDKSMMELDASRCWLVFWTIHSLDLLDAFDPQAYCARVLRFLDSSWDSSTGVGGWGGGPRQQAHLAPTYAATASLLVLDAVDKWLSSSMSKGRKRHDDTGGCPGDMIGDFCTEPDKNHESDGAREGDGDEQEEHGEDPRQGLYDWFLQVKNPDGGFCMHVDGEVDVRGTYCAIATASMLHMLTDEIAEGVAEYVASCQTEEGGLGGEPHLEAHGGYTYCGLAALLILNKAHVVLDLDRLLHWAVHRQMGFEGGFQGRTHKLVDACYSFWQGGIFALLAEAFRQAGRTWYYESMKNLWVSGDHLQYYILGCCQDPRGGLRDKPGKRADLYHTCYALSGLSVAQHSLAVPTLVHSPPSSPALVSHTQQDGQGEGGLTKDRSEDGQEGETTETEDDVKRKLDKTHRNGDAKESVTTSEKKAKSNANRLARTDIFYNVRVDKVLSTRRKLLNHLPPFIEKRTGSRGSEGKGVVSYYNYYQIV
ncbi:prenyltransferase and squalene oxidase repeat-containing protein [Cystoisospora suis]|uniref:Protein farnesyltransferase subunit beta n=1 Tax=Cystoisospora suis TaxID=483139 RepID=A0A2C6KQM4_9APIC|nr:prenyltransferase and squalene oxidase repeat-containing protein [Cystoisospora suis]